MAVRWTVRRAHLRSLSGGRVVPVRETLVPIEKIPTSDGSYRSPCPKCGAPIVSVQMKNKGWVHFEGTQGLDRIKHPCMHLGEKLSRRRDQDTPDLFADPIEDK